MMRHPIRLASAFRLEVRVRRVWRSARFQQRRCHSPLHPSPMEATRDSRAEFSKQIELGQELAQQLA
jgi:hypothetical protein